ncbi:MAG: oligosaccharide flippase family protein [Lachnospiraceae bacterium]|nr:oligosaccharide flippase family protein [Lachnospiraceae bacterium]
MEKVKTPNRIKLFLENMLVYGLGGAIGKLIPFIMLPIITRLLPDTFYFGVNDISSLIVSFGQAVVIMGMYDAMFRTFFDVDSEEKKKEVCSTALRVVMGNIVIITLVFIVFGRYLTQIFYHEKKYYGLLWLSLISIICGALNGIISAPARMENKRSIFLISNITSSFISYTLSIILLIRGYYLTALPVGTVVANGLLLIFYLLLNKKWFSLKKFNRGYLHEMLLIAFPLIPNMLLYWIFNSCDRMMITAYLGLEADGIYAAGAKIGQVSQLIYTAFAGGWQYFAFSTMKDDDQVEMTSKIFEYLGIVTFIAGMAMMLVCRFVFQIMFPERYKMGYIVSPYLFVSPLLLMLYQTAGNQFIVIKKTWVNLFVLVIGALTNVGVNWWLIRCIGIEGAAIGTFMGYVVSVFGVVILLQKMKLLKISKKFLVTVMIFITYGIVWRLHGVNNSVLMMLMFIVAIFVYIFIYWKDVKLLVNRWKK